MRRHPYLRIIPSTMSLLKETEIIFYKMPGLFLNINRGITLSQKMMVLATPRLKRIYDILSVYNNRK